MKIKALYLYLLSLGWLVLLAIILKFAGQNVTGFGITLTILTLIFLPGTALWRILRLGDKAFFAKYLYIIGLGFGFYFLINLFGLLANLNINQILWLTILILAIIFILAMVLDRNEVVKPDFDHFKHKSFGEWLLIIFSIAGSIFAFLAIDAQTDRLIGDAWFHLGIMEKIVSGSGISPANLNPTKTSYLSIIYSFPLWHIFVAEVTKILSITIFTALKQSVLALSILAMITWFSFIKVLVKNQLASLVIYLSFIFVFLHDNAFYFLVALPSPDSLNRLLLMPLILGLATSFIFEGGLIYKASIIIGLLAIFMGLIHFTQLIYLILILLVLLVLIAVFERQKEKLLRVLAIYAGIGIFTLPYLLIFQATTAIDFLKSNARVFTGDHTEFNTYLGANILYRYAIVFLLPILLFVKKQKALIVLVSIMVSSLFIYWPFLGLRNFFLKYFGEVFTNRALANIPHFIFIGLGLFLALYFINLSVRKIAWLKWGIAGLFFLLLIVFIIQPGPWYSFVDKILMSEEFGLLTKYFWLTFVVIAALNIVIAIVYRKKELDYQKPVETLPLAISAISVFLLLSLPYFGNVNQIMKKNPNGTIFSNRMTYNMNDLDSLGGQKTVDFFQSQHRQVFLTDNVALAQKILLYSDNYLYEYPYGIEEFITSWNFYNGTLDDTGKFKMLNDGNVNFVIIRHEEEKTFFEKYPDKFQLACEAHYFYQKDRVLYIYEYRK